MDAPIYERFDTNEGFQARGRPAAGAARPRAARVRPRRRGAAAERPAAHRARSTRFLLASRTRRLYLVVHSTDHLTRQCPRLLTLLRRFSHAMQINQHARGDPRGAGRFPAARRDALRAPPGGDPVPRRDGPGRRERRPGAARALRRDLGGVLSRGVQHYRRLVGKAVRPFSRYCASRSLRPGRRCRSSPPRSPSRARARRGRAPAVVLLRKVRADDVLQARAVERAEQAPRSRGCRGGRRRRRRAPSASADRRRPTACRGRSCTRAPARRRPDSICCRCGVGLPRSVTTPSFAAPSERTYCTGSRASCGTVKGSTIMPSTKNDWRPFTTCDRHAVDHLALGLERGERAVREVDGDAVRGGEAEHAAGMVAVLVGDEDAAHLRGLEAGALQAPLGLGEREPAVEHHHACRRPRPPGSCPSCRWRARRSASGLLELLVEQREDALRGLGALGGAFLVLHLAPGCRSVSRRVTWMRYCAALTFESFENQPAMRPKKPLSFSLHLGLGIGVAHEVQALLPVAVLDGEADAVEREADAAPGAVEGSCTCSALGAVVALDDVGALLRRRGSRRAASPSRRARRAAPSAGAGSRPRAPGRRRAAATRSARRAEVGSRVV